MEHSGLKLAGVANAWQLGGYAAADGRRVKANVLLRSGKPIVLEPSLASSQPSSHRDFLLDVCLFLNPSPSKSET